MRSRCSAINLVHEISYFLRRVSIFDFKRIPKCVHDFLVLDLSVLAKALRQMD